jgi:hypothetical protein
VVDDHGMIGLRPAQACPNAEPSTPPVGSPNQRDALSRATLSLMQTAAAVRRSAGEPLAAAELSHALGHVEEALDDLSAGMARIARGIDAGDSPGGVAWRLRTLQHALHAARDLCAGATVAAASDESRQGVPRRRLTDDPRAA